MIIDERTHFATIEYYAANPSPFQAEQPTQMDGSGVVARNLNILYYFLLGNVYNFISLFTDYFPAKVVLLRLLHIGFFAGGLFFVYRTIRLLGLSRPAANSTILLFSLLPIATFLAAHINYDNLLFLIGSAHIYLAIKFISSRRQPESLSVLLLFLVTGLAASLVKFTFVPVFVASLSIVIFTNLWKNRGRILPMFGARKQWTKTAIISAVFLLALVVMGAERYVGNYLRYSALMPSCPKVLSEKRCESSELYQRDKILGEAGKNTARISYTDYLTLWGNSMHDGLYFLGVKPFTDPQTYDSRTASDSVIVPKPPAYLKTFTWLMAIAGTAAFLLAFHRARSKKLILVIGAISGLYILTLFLTNHATYIKYGQPLAIQGRYLILFLPYLLGLTILATNILIKSRQLKVTLLLVVLFSFSQGGGFISYIKNSDQRWYWENHYIIETNQKVRSALNGIVIFE